MTVAESMASNIVSDPYVLPTPVARIARMIRADIRPKKQCLTTVRDRLSLGFILAGGCGFLGQLDRYAPSERIPAVDVSALKHFF